MQTIRTQASRALALFLCSLLLAQPIYAQKEEKQPRKKKQEQQQSEEPRVPGGSASRRIVPGAIRIVPLEGHRVVNSILTKTTISPVVQVLDSNDQPVTGVDVTFSAPPPSGGAAGGAFGNAPMITVKSDAVGQATAQFTSNFVPGRFAIRVQAVFGEQKSETFLVQTNDADALMAGIPDPPRRWYKNWKWWAAIAAGATAGGILASRAGGGGSPTITINPAPVGIGGPR